MSSQIFHIDLGTADTVITLPVQAEAPVRAIPYPARTAAGLTKSAKNTGLEAAKAEILALDPAAAESQSTASLNRKGT